MDYQVMLSRIIQIIKTINDITKRTAKLIVVADSCIKVHQEKQALDLLLQIINKASEEQELALAIAYSLFGVIEKYIENFPKQLGSKILLESLQTIEVYQSDKLYQIDGRYYNRFLLTITRSYAQLGENEQAFKIAYSIYYKTEKYMALYSIAFSYIKMHELEQAFKIAELMKQTIYSHEVLAQIAIYYLERGLIARSLQLTIKHINDDTFIKVVRKYVNQGYDRHIIEIVNNIKYVYSCSTQKLLFEEIFKEYVLIQQYEKALHILANIDYSITQKRKLIKIIAEEYASSGYYYQAIEMVKFIKNTYDIQYVLDKIIEKCVINNSTNEAIGIFTLILEIAKSIKFLPNKILSLINLAEGYIRLEFHNNVAEVILELEREKLENEGERLDTYVYITCLYAKTRNFNIALDRILHIYPACRRALPLATVAAYCIKIKKKTTAYEILNQAIQAVKSDEDLERRVYAFPKIIMEFLDIQQDDFALKIVEAIEKEEQAGNHRLHVMFIVADTFFRHNRQDKACEVLSRMLDILMQSPDSIKNAGSLDNVAKLWAKMASTGGN